MEEFKAEVRAGHKGYGVEVPFDPQKKWGIAAVRLRKGRNGHRVRGTINGVAFLSAIVPRMKRYFVEFDEDTVLAANTGAGKTVTVAIEPLDVT
jgi:hypothetical protein